jgi:hypothetical protein
MLQMEVCVRLRVARSGYRRRGIESRCKLGSPPEALGAQLSWLFAFSLVCTGFTGLLAWWQREYVTAYKWTLFEKKSRIVLPPTYYPAFSIVQVKFNHDPHVVQAVSGYSAPASTAVVDWFNFDASLPLLSADADTAGASHSEAQRLIQLANVQWNLQFYRCSHRPLRDAIVSSASADGVLRERTGGHPV